MNRVGPDRKAFYYDSDTAPSHPHNDASRCVPPRPKREKPGAIDPGRLFGKKYLDHGPTPEVHFPRPGAGRRDRRIFGPSCRRGDILCRRGRFGGPSRMQRAQRRRAGEERLRAGCEYV